MECKVRCSWVLVGSSSKGLRTVGIPTIPGTQVYGRMAARHVIWPLKCIRLISVPVGEAGIR